jgi:predicted double-glycine peptidase
MMFARRQPPCIRQHDVTDCGAASLASIAAFYGVHVPIARVRQYVSAEREGTTALGLVEGARRLGLEAKGVRAQEEALAHVPLPAIAHQTLQGNRQHYVVVCKVVAKYVIVMDPAEGKRRRVPCAEFMEHWTRVLILFATTPIDGKNVKQDSLGEKGAGAAAQLGQVLRLKPALEHGALPALAVLQQHAGQPRPLAVVSNIVTDGIPAHGGRWVNTSHGAAGLRRRRRRQRARANRRWR